MKQQCPQWSQCPMHILCGSLQRQYFCGPCSMSYSSTVQEVSDEKYNHVLYWGDRRDEARAVDKNWHACLVSMDLKHTQTSWRSWWTASLLMNSTCLGGGCGLHFSIQGSNFVQLLVLIHGEWCLSAICRLEVVPISEVELYWMHAMVGLQFCLQGYNSNSHTIYK